MKYAFNNARNCLRAFLRSADVKELQVPYELCSVVFKAARSEGIRLKFYHIDKNFMPQTNFARDAYILYPNYFGICDKQAQELSKEFPNFIYDATQSFFSEPLGIATIYSARKFFPVTDGGFLITDLKINTDYEKEDEVSDFSTDPLNFDYEKFLQNELKFNRSNKIKLISEKSRERLRRIDFERAKLERIENFKKLHEIFAPINELELPQEINAPMVYPLKCSTDSAKGLDESGVFFIRYNYMKNIRPLPLTSKALLDYIQ